MTIRVGVFGAGGRMGSTVCRAVADDPDLELVAAVDPLHVGIDLRQVTGADVTGLQMSPDADALLAAGATVAVDFTHVDAARANIEWCAANGVHAVVGTTGFVDEDFERLASLFTTSNCFVAPNFAIGAVLMMRFRCSSSRASSRRDPGDRPRRPPVGNCPVCGWSSSWPAASSWSARCGSTP